MGMLLQVLKIIFKVQMKMNNEKTINKEKKNPTYKTHFFLWTPPTFKPNNFFISYLFNDLNCYRSTT
jgi:hypothetical protein